jgi:hypothetical protein
MASSLAFQPSGDPTNTWPSHQSIGLREKYRLDGIKLELLRESRRGPQIGYTPDLSQYLRRASVSLRNLNLPKEVPVGWPESLNHPLAWTGVDFHNEESYIHRLSDDEISDIKTALDYFNGMFRNKIWS